MKSRESFLWYKSDRDIYEMLPLEERDELFRAVQKYVFDEITPVFSSGEVRMAFMVIKSHIDRDFTKYQRVCEKNRENVRRRWYQQDSTEYERIPNDTTVYDRIPSNTMDTKHTYNDNDTGNDQKKSKPKEKFSFVDSDFYPDVLKVPEFIEAWKEWESYRQAKKKTITECSAKKQLAALAKFPVNIGIDAINTSIMNGWQGIFPKGISTTKPVQAQQQSSGTYGKVGEHTTKDHNGEGFLQG